MGYRSEVRVLLPENDFNALDAKLKALGENEFCEYDVMQNRTEDRCTYNEDRPLKNYVYFGWDCIKWYDDWELVQLVEEAVMESEDCHFVRLGESWDDFEENCKLEGYIDGIQFYRYFEDEVKKPPCSHCTKPFSSSTLIYQNGELLPNTTINFCPKCGKKLNGGTCNERTNF